MTAVDRPRSGMKDRERNFDEIKVGRNAHARAKIRRYMYIYTRASRISPRKRATRRLEKSGLSD